MQVRGIFSEGRPQISGLLVLPGLSGLEPVPVNFLVDSGADRSVVTVNEYKDYFSYPSTLRYPPRMSLGFGGGLVTRLVPARLALRTEDGSYIFQPLIIEIPNPKRWDKTLPSVMGRDILNCFSLHIDRTAGVVLLDEPADAAARYDWLLEGMDDDELGADFDGMPMAVALEAVRSVESYPGLKR
jgi:hypothetical protein